MPHSHVSCFMNIYEGQSKRKSNLQGLQSCAPERQSLRYLQEPEA
jgi:hypothetical protein